MPSGRRAPRTSLPSQARCGLRDRPGHGEGDGPGLLGRREISGHGPGQGRGADQAEEPGDRPGARRGPPPVRRGAGAERGQVLLAGVPDPGGDVGEQGLAVQHRRHHQRQHARAGSAGAPRGHAGPATSAKQSRTLPAGRRPQLRQPVPAAPGGHCRPPRAAAPASARRRSRFRSALRSRPAVQAPRGPGPCGPARRSPPSSRPAARRTISSRLRDHRLGGVGGRRACKTGRATGPPGGKGSVRYPLSYPRPRCPAPEVTRPVRNATPPGNSPSPTSLPGCPPPPAPAVTTGN